MACSIRWHSSYRDIPADLWDRCFAAPLEGRWWYAALEDCGIGDQFTFAYAEITRDGQPIGVAPTFLMDVPLDIIAPDKIAGLVRFIGRFIRFARYQRTLFVGSPCSDEGSVGLIAGVSLADVADDLQTDLEKRARQCRASMIVWKDFAEPDFDALKFLASSRGLFRVTSFPGTRVPLPTGGTDAYLKSLKGSRRHNLKKKLRQGQAVCPTVVTVLQNPPPAVLDEIFPLFWQTYLKGKTKFEKLNRDFFTHIAAAPTSHFVLLRHRDTGQLVAFMLCFDLKPRAINKFIGIDYRIDDAYLYFQLWMAALEWAYLHGMTEFQSGQTGYRAKTDLGHQLVPLDNFACHRNRLIHRIFAWQARGISWNTIDADLANYLAAHPTREASD